MKKILLLSIFLLSSLLGVFQVSLASDRPLEYRYYKTLAWEYFCTTETKSSKIFESNFNLCKDYGVDPVAQSNIGYSMVSYWDAPTGPYVVPISWWSASNAGIIKIWNTFTCIGDWEETITCKIFYIEKLDGSFVCWDRFVGYYPCESMTNLQIRITDSVPKSDIETVILEQENSEDDVFDKYTWLFHSHWKEITPESATGMYIRMAEMQWIIKRPIEAQPSSSWITLVVTQPEVIVPTDSWATSLTVRVAAQPEPISTHATCKLNWQEVNCAQMAEAAKSWLSIGLWGFLIFWVLFLLGGIFWLVMLIHAISNPIPNKAVWIIVIFFGSLFGAIIYYFVIKKRHTVVLVPSVPTVSMQNNTATVYPDTTVPVSQIVQNPIPMATTTIEPVTPIVQPSIIASTEATNIPPSV